MCSCDAFNVETDYSTSICTKCGLETQTGLDMIQKEAPRDMTPFPVGYSRYKRFSKILDGVLFPTPTISDNQMLEHLMKKKFATITELIKYMKNAPLRDKRYTSLHLFCRLFVEGYIPPRSCNYSEVKSCIMKRFQDVEFGHLRFCPKEQFFNYNHLLVILLRESGLTDHTQFVKDLRCKRRKLFYGEMLLKIRSAYTDAEAVAGASRFRTWPVERLDGLLPPLVRTPTSEETCAVPLPTYTPDRTGKTQSGFEGSCRSAREGIPFGQVHQRPKQPLSKCV